MATRTANAKILPEHTTRRREASEYRLVFLLTYPLFLVASLLGRLHRGRNYFVSSRTARRGSVFVEAKALANATIPYAFMGW